MKIYNKNSKNASKSAKFVESSSIVFVILCEGGRNSTRWAPVKKVKAFHACTFTRRVAPWYRGRVSSYRLGSRVRHRFKGPLPRTPAHVRGIHGSLILDWSYAVTCSRLVFHARDSTDRSIRLSHSRLPRAASKKSSRPSGFVRDWIWLKLDCRFGRVPDKLLLIRASESFPPNVNGNLISLILIYLLRIEQDVLARVDQFWSRKVTDAQYLN